MKVFRHLLFILLVLCNNAFAQKQNNQWRFGSAGAIDFNKVPPSFVSGCSISTPEGSASIADKSTGALLFYTDGVSVWNAKNQVMPNGKGLLGGTPTGLSSTTAAVIIPKPGSNNFHYIVTIDEQVSSNGVRYSIVDMNLNGGLGDIVADKKNIFLLQTNSEKLEVVPASDGVSYWLISHDEPGNTFFSFKVTTSGIQNSPVVSTIGSVQGNGAGHMKVNRNFNKLAIGVTFSSTIELFDFDNATGIVSNPISWKHNLSNPLIYGIEFSPNGKVLYISNLDKLLQFDITQSTASAIGNSVYQLTTGSSEPATLQMASNDKIYINAGNIAVINNPNELGKACGYQSNAVANQSGGGGYGLPKWVYYFNNIKFTNKSICNDLTHEFTNETDTNWFDYSWWFWGDGDSSKSDNSQPKIRHQYRKPGKYNVLLKSIKSDGGWFWHSDSVNVLPEPIAKYFTKNKKGCQWIAAEFIDSSILEQKSHTWSWNFGDSTDTIIGSSGNIMPKNKSIEHTYNSSGKFKVQLQVSDGRCTDTFVSTQDISILPAPRPGIAIDKTTGCIPLEVQFGRKYSDLADSTIYDFKPVLLPNNRFNNAVNKTTILQSGKFALFQKLYGQSGCVTQDSVTLFITPEIPIGYRPQLKRSTVVDNRTTLTEWKCVPHAKNYQVYRNGLKHDVVNDTFFIDYLASDIDQSYTYEIQATDSCDNLAGNKSNIGKTIYLHVKEIEPVIKSEFTTALLTWTPYGDWTSNDGVKTYQCFGTYDVESGSWLPINSQNDTLFNDKDFIQPKKFEKCFLVKARSGDLVYESQSNSYCLGYQGTLFAPNSFTPNGDGLNDKFEIFNFGFDRFSLTIYNSWGQKLFEQNNSEGTWTPSKDVPQGVYVYQVKAYRKGKEYSFSSTVTLLR